MALVADTQHAVEMLYGMQTELQQTGDEELGQQLSDMINMMESPLFTQLLTLQQSMRQLRDHVESTPPGKPIGEFDFTPSGDLVFEEPPKPEPVEQPGPAHPYAYENEINLEDEIGKVQVASVEESAPPQPVVAADELDTGDALLDSIAELAMGREVTTVKLMKPEKGGLGFSVVGLKSENHGELGIFVQQIQPNGVAERNGDLHESDQILAINGHLLDVSISHQQAIEMLQKVKGLVELVVARGVFQLPTNALKDADPPKEEEQPTSPEKQQPEDAQIEPPQHEIQQIELYNDGSGLGFGIVGVRDVGIMVKTILPGGTADRDGRLQSGDIILQIGDTPLQGMTSDQVATVLRQAGSHVRLTVARSAFPVAEAPRDTEPLIQPEPVIRPQQMTEDNSQPPPQLDLEEELQGVQMFDVVLEKEAKGLGITIAGYVRDVATGQVSGIFIKKISEGSAADRNGNVKVNDQIIEVDGQSLDGFTNVEAVDMLRNTGSVVHVKLARHPEGTLDISNVNMEQSEGVIISEQIQPTQVVTEEEAPPVAPPAYPPPVGILEPVEPDPEPEVAVETYEEELSTETEVRLMSAWQAILGDDVMIVVAQLSKFREGGGLGISLEGTVDIDESGEEVRPHHYIRSILADGPVGQNAQLKSGDELLEVNGEQLLGLNHVDVVKTLKELPMHVRIVCARHPHPVFPEATEVPQPKVQEVVVAPDAQEEVFTTSQTNLQESLPFPEVAMAGSVLAVQTNLRENSAERASPLSRESLGGLAVWDDELQTVDLIKGDKGLGFSILDYQDPLNPTKTVIVIRSLVPGGVAESDGRLIPGDRLAFVNDGNLDNCSLEMAVQALKGAPPGPVLLRVAKPLPQPMDGPLEGEEPLIMPQQIASVHQAPPSRSQEISFLDEDLEKIRELQASLHTSRQVPSSDARPNEDELLVEEVIVSASVSSNVESSMDLSQILSDKPEPAPAPPASTAPPDLVLASTLSHTKPQDTDVVNAAPVPAVRSTPPEPRRHPPAPPPKPSPRSSLPAAAAAAAPAASTVDDSQMSEKDPRVATVAASHSPLSKRESVVLPNFLEKSIVLKKGNAGLGLTVNADKSNGVMVKSIIRGGAVHHDGRLAVGDLITSVNDESVRGLTNAEARALLRRASLIGSDISITYIPASDASAYRENPSSISLAATDPNVSQSEGSAVAPLTIPTSSLPAEDGSDSEKFALPLRDQPSDSVRLASVALSPVSVASGSEWEDIRTVRLTKEPNKSLGISIVGGRAGDGQPVQGIYIKHVLDDSQAGRTHALKTGDRILEVNGCDLRDASHDYAVAIIRNAANPVCFIVQSLSAGANPFTIEHSNE